MSSSEIVQILTVTVCLYHAVLWNLHSAKFRLCYLHVQNSFRMYIIVHDRP